MYNPSAYSLSRCFALRRRRRAILIASFRRVKCLRFDLLIAEMIYGDNLLRPEILAAIQYHAGLTANASTRNRNQAQAMNAKARNAQQQANGKSMGHFIIGAPVRAQADSR